MGLFIFHFIKNVAFAIANHKSREIAEQDMERDVDEYNKQNTKSWSLTKSYEVLAACPKWVLDHVHPHDELGSATSHL